jgi:hypothetical protein
MALKAGEVRTFAVVKARPAVFYTLVKPRKFGT